MSEAQIDTLAAAATKVATRHAGQGEVAHFMLSKDGNTIALRQEHPPLREFCVADALGKTTAEHWQKAVALSQESRQDVVPGLVQQVLVAEGHTPPQREQWCEGIGTETRCEQRQGLLLGAPD